VNADAPIVLRASARVELARLYALQGDFLTGVSISRSVPNQFPGVWVGRFSGEKTYFGKVEVICALDAARFAQKSGNYHQAMLLIFDLLRDHKSEKVGSLHGMTDLQYLAVLSGRNAIVKLSTAEYQRISKFQDLSNACTSPLAKAKLQFFIADQFIETFSTLGNVHRISDALSQYKKIIRQFPKVVEPSSIGDILLSVEAVRKVRVLMIDHAKDSRRGIYELTEIERRSAARLALFEGLIGAAHKYVKAYEMQSDPMLTDEAVAEYREVIRDNPDLIVPRPSKDGPMSGAEAVRTRGFLLSDAKVSRKAVYELAKIEIETAKNEAVYSRAIAAYARYHFAMIVYKNQKNMAQAIYILELLLEKYPEVLEYPLPKDANPKPTLDAHVKKMIKQIRLKNL
jgi:tetratricopeptide (TPR) repeat protein